MSEAAPPVLTPEGAHAVELLDAAPDAIVVIQADERIFLVNFQAERLFDYARAELIGQKLELLIPERFRSGHQQHVARYFASPVVRPMGSRLELFGRRKDGAEIPIEVSLSPVRSSRGTLVAAAIRDITERRRVEASAKTSADRLSSAVESIQDAIAVFDAHDRLVLCNSAYRHLLMDTTTGALIGRSYESLLDAWLGDLSFASDEERAQFRTERLANRKDPQGAVDVRTRDGRNLRIIDRRTVDGGIVKTVWDLTQDVHLAEELRQAQVAAEAGSSAKSEFLSSMSHELRTPLNAILGFAQLLQRDKKEPLSTRHKDRVDQILKGGEHLLRLIDDILDLSRIEAGRVSISAERVGVSDVLQTVRTTLEPMAARLGIHLEMASLGNSAPVVHADRTRFAQILMNFGSNAIKYNRPGGRVTFRVTEPSPDTVRVTVEDTGMGIAASKQDKLFQPFQRAGQETGPIEGTGIGLVITRRLAELMHGVVGFSSTEGKGSEFWVEMPAHESHHSSVPPAAPAASLHFAAVAKTTVLYVEDNPANVTFMEDLLGNFESLQLITAPTAEMGVELARAKHPAIIIMDINLPGMSGLDALQVLRAQEETRKIPVIALTAAASDRDRKRGEEAGFFRYLTKPVKVDELEKALQLLLNAAPEGKAGQRA
jgi:PAS domain S-box-containing protein